MSLKARVQDAVMLWENGRMEGAFLCALIAVAATARRRYPDRNKVKDRDAFERFLTDAMSVRLSVEYRGECHPIEHILYKWLRCELVHEGDYRSTFNSCPKMCSLFEPAVRPNMCCRYRAAGSITC